MEHTLFSLNMLYMAMVHFLVLTEEAFLSPDLRAIWPLDCYVRKSVLYYNRIPHRNEFMFNTVEHKGFLRRSAIFKTVYNNF